MGSYEKLSSAGAADEPTARVISIHPEYNRVMTQLNDVTPSLAAGLLQLARIKSGLSQKQLADKAGVASTMISAYERDLRQPTLPTLLRLLNAAGLDLRMQLVDLDPHDGVLDRLEQDRSPEDRERRDRLIEMWREATPA